MSQVQAARTSIVELRHLVAGKNRELQERWEVARWMRWQAHLLSPDVKPVHKKNTAHAWYPFPWEEPVKDITPEDCHVTAEEEKALNAILEDFQRRKAAAQI